MGDVLAVSLGVALGMGAGFAVLAFVAPRVFDAIIRRCV